MATLNIGGKRVTVDDAFLSMSPEQQQQTVDEIAKSIGITGSNQPASSQSSDAAAYDDALSVASQASQSLNSAPGQMPQQQPLRSDLPGATAATISGIVNGIPVIGPLAQRASDNLMGIGAQLTGGDYDQTVEGLRNRRDQLANANPAANIAGNLAGGVGAYGLASKLAGGAEALGSAGPLLTKTINSGLSTLGLGIGDSVVRGHGGMDAIKENLAPAAIATAIPGVGAGLGAAIRAGARKAQPLIGALTQPVKEAERRFGSAVQRDIDANPEMTLRPADIAVAEQSGIPLVNADKGGETVRALARSVANQSPEARAVIDKTASDRFAGQAGRAVNFVRRIAGGNVDDLAYQQSLKDMADAVNKPAYEAANNAPGAQAVFTVDLQELMQSPAVQKAISMTKTRGADMAAIAGQKPVVNPFRQDAKGTWKLVQRANGTLAVPNLAFWDQVKRNLDGMIGKAQRSGDREKVSVLMQLKSKLVNSLDDAVPEYAQARRGAAAFFGAENALDAGKNFANATRSLPEAQQAFTAMKPAEQKAFRVGYASEIIDKIKDARFRANVIDQAFGSPAKREMFATVFGPQKARELEAYIRVEDLADKLRGALGNSTTARQLMELGIGAGSGAILTGGDWKGALTGAALVKGAKMLGSRADDKVLQELARLLTTGDDAALQRAVNQASLSPVWMDGLVALGKAADTAAHGAALALPVN